MLIITCTLRKQKYYKYICTILWCFMQLVTNRRLVSVPGNTNEYIELSGRTTIEYWATIVPCFYQAETPIRYLEAHFILVVCQHHYTTVSKRIDINHGAISNLLLLLLGSSGRSIRPTSYWSSKLMSLLFL